MSADRWKTGNAVWQQSPADFKARYCPDNPAPFGRTERDVLTVLFFASKPEQKGEKEVRITPVISQSEIAKRAGISEPWVKRALKNLYNLGKVKMIERGGEGSKGSRYAVWHLPKEGN